MITYKIEELESAPAISQEMSSPLSNDNSPAETPTIEDHVYKNLPKGITNLFEHFSNSREKDLILLSALGVLSTCYPYFRGRYDGRLIRSNLYLLISAPASAGKGIIYYSKILGQQIHDRYLKKYNDEIAEYEIAIAAHKADPDGPAPVKPKLMKFIIPGNTSSAKLIETLSTNKEFGLIFETEIDTLTGAMKTASLGDSNDLLRKAFHHEPVELQRKGNDEYLHVKTPCLSIVISGTPNQVKSLLNNIENGLFSRFLLYDFPIRDGFKNVFENSDVNFDMPFLKLAMTLNTFNEYINTLGPANVDPLQENGRIIQLTKTQEIKFVEFFKEKQVELAEIYGDDIVASVRRLGIIAFRIAMILTITRIIDTKEKANYDLVCCDQDIETALSIIDTLLVHTIKVYSQLKDNGRAKNKPNKKLYYESLPETFNRKKAMTIASYLGIKEKTAENYLSRLIQEEVLQRPEHNCYTKI